MPGSPSREELWRRKKIRLVPTVSCDNLILKKKICDCGGDTTAEEALITLYTLRSIPKMGEILQEIDESNLIYKRICKQFFDLVPDSAGGRGRFVTYSMCSGRGYSMGYKLRASTVSKYM